MLLNSFGVQLDQGCLDSPKAKINKEWKKMETAVVRVPRQGQKWSCFFSCLHYYWGVRSLRKKLACSASVPRSYMRDEGRSLEAGLQEQASNPLKLLW